MDGLDFSLDVRGAGRVFQAEGWGSPMNKVLEIAKCGKFNKEWLSLVGIYGLE